nr:ribonuclease H-like domain-containing protein [Tanacetum cinerariifolium]
MSVNMKPSKPSSFLRWSPTGRMFDLNGKILASSKSESQSDCSKGDNACTSNPMEPSIKRSSKVIASINGKRFFLVIVKDYSRYAWVHFLRSKGEAPDVIKTFPKRINVLLQSPVIIIRSDNDTEFKNQLLKEYFYSVGEDDESLAKHKALELEIERLLRAVVSQDIMFVVQKAFVVDTSNL